MEAVQKGIVSDHWSTVMQTATFIDLRIIIQAKLGLCEVLILHL